MNVNSQSSPLTLFQPFSLSRAIFSEPLLRPPRGSPPLPCCRAADVLAAAAARAAARRPPVLVRLAARRPRPLRPPPPPRGLHCLCREQGRTGTTCMSRAGARDLLRVLPHAARSRSCGWPHASGPPPPLLGRALWSWTGTDEAACMSFCSRLNWTIGASSWWRSGEAPMPPRDVELSCCRRRSCSPRHGPRRLSAAASSAAAARPRDAELSCCRDARARRGTARAACPRPLLRRHRSAAPAELDGRASTRRTRGTREGHERRERGGARGVVRGRRARVGELSLRLTNS